MEWLVVSENRYQRDRNGYRASVDARLNIDIDYPVPVIREEDGAFIGLASVYEYHITADGTTVFFTIDADSFNGKDAKAIARLYQYVSGQRPKKQTYAESSGFKASSTMDPAMAMSMGLGRDPNDIARRAGRRAHKDDDDDGIPMADIFRT